jgi:hypothetical protein
MFEGNIEEGIFKPKNSINYEKQEGGKKFQLTIKRRFEDI